MFNQDNDQTFPNQTRDSPSLDTKSKIKRLNNGDIYIAEKKKQPCGQEISQCLKISKKGYKYEGQCVNEIYHGIGRLINEENGEEYYGEFNKGKRSGLGCWNDYKNGLKYLGYFVDDIRSGYGTWSTNKGDRLIQCEFINGVAMNFGILIDKSEKY